jgi:hypothetical protein
MDSSKIFLFCVLAVVLSVQACSRRLTSAGQAFSIQQRIIIPVVGCDAGEPVPNVAIPLEGGARPACVSRGEASSLPVRQSDSSQETRIEIGTVIVIGFSREQVILAADSRSGLFRGARFVGTDDQRCKLVNWAQPCCLRRPALRRRTQVYLRMSTTILRNWPERQLAIMSSTPCG